MSGSSPLTRGTRGEGGSRGSPARLIPARAGNIYTRPVRSLRSTAHPRSRGEHDTVKTRLGFGSGSSPLARGTYTRIRAGVSLHRFIPARAGITMRDLCSLIVTPAHPRSRGEHPSPGSPEITIDGSSPLARGTFMVFSFLFELLRLIPARAGNMSCLLSPSFRRSAHPRSRGGTSRNSPTGFRKVRFIPARAGNTSRTLSCTD